ncbi:hypothetical protein FHS57_006232 [Runella defluvii]|uniref:Uncharacterized protein n=1 Tax=Runella defluvii TaxID=370973 RepID=A0A7W5ZUA1_9BACT|nr:hypothetical protein [Runella defluvii]MBB3842201.1 hypothetical protein [Runella defluvii]
MERIGITSVLTKIKKGGANHTFDLTYRKEDGRLGRKENVRNRVGLETDTARPKRDLSSIAVESSQAGKLHLVDEHGQKFDLFICLLIKYNGTEIDHEK